jgi:carboxypeptidase Q
MHRVLFTGSLTLFFLGTQAQQDDSLLIRKMADEILVHSKAYENLRTLTKTVGPRLSGTPQTYQAERWGQQTLTASGADKVYLQQCMIPHWLRDGPDQARMITSSGTQEELRVLALGNSTGTGAGGLTAPVMMVNSFDELEQKKDQVKGKIVFYNYKFNPKFIQTFMAYGDAVRYRGAGASRAAKYGAVGVLVRSMTESVDNNPHTGAMRYTDSFPKIPAMAVGLWDADKLATALGQGEQVNVFMRTLAHSLPDTVGYNVVAELTGSEFPNQFIDVGGHLDSWDPAEGAQDDGAGCVQSIEVLRALKAIGYKPRHTIRVILFTDEENGGTGSLKYAQEAKEKKEDHLFGLESDAGGFTPRWFNLDVSAPQFAKFRAWIPLLIPYGVYSMEHGGGGADMDPLHNLLGTPVGELVPDSQRYFDYHHSAGDVFEVVNKRELELGAINMTALIYLVDKYGW